MNNSTVAKLDIRRLPWSLLMMPIIYISVAVFGLRDYMEWTSINVLIGLGAMPLLIEQTNKKQTTSRFFILALGLAMLGILIPVKTALYLALCAALLYVYESRIGRLTLLPFTTLFLMSPICQYLAHIFSFPIRLWLTQIAATILQMAGLATKVTGNIISFQLSEFSVDPACLGLNMLITSLLCGIIIIAFYQKKLNVQLKLHWLVMALVLLIGLNVVSNLMRILILVYFKIMPENIMHDVVGIFCLLTYVLVPSMVLLKLLVRKKGASTTWVIKDKTRIANKYVTHVILIIAITTASWRVGNKADFVPTKTLPIIANYQSSWYDNDVMKLKSSTSLIYIKPLKGFIYTDHNPLICWTGSGYTFQQIEEQHWDNLKLHTGILVNGNDKLYTAWWYDNGTLTTTEQWKWRWEMFCGSKPFSIINISANNIADLKTEINKFKSIKNQVFAGYQNLHKVN